MTSKATKRALGLKPNRLAADSDRVISAQIDPRREVLLDLNKLDDGRTRERTPAGARRWTLEFKAWSELVYAMLESL